MDLCARPRVAQGTHLSFPPNDFRPFRSPAGTAMSCNPCAGTLSALSVLPQVLPSLPLNDFRPFRSLAGTGRALSHVGRSPAGRGRRAGTGLRPYPSHCATLVGPSRSRSHGRLRRPPALASPASLPSGLSIGVFITF